MQPLPIDPLLPDVVRHLGDGGVLVLAAPPGSGKTTRVPGALVDAGLPGQVLVLEPRRLAARAAARRVASERGSRVGGGVGFQVRHERRVSAETAICFVTEGILLRRLVRDPFLEGVGTVILDEFHERHLEGDLALAMLAEVRATVRPDLRILAMSATLDAEPLAAFLECPVLRAEGSVFPVEISHVDRVETTPLPDRVRRVLGSALDETEGDVLVFLPGVGEIKATQARIADLVARCGADCTPLHGGLEPAEQDRAIRRGDRRKVVLATNVAESSVTIDGVTAVVDGGYARVLRHDPARGMDVLRLERISMASAEQRRGRAGRVAPGRCYRLWSRVEERSFAAFDTPEIRRIDLSGPLLQVRAFAGRDPRAFGWFEAPETAALERADALLSLLGAVDAGGRVTELGQRLLELPLHPRLGRMIAWAERAGCVAAVADVAALLSERDIELRGDRAASTAAVLELADRWRDAHRRRLRAEDCRAVGLDPGAVRAVARARDQIVAAARCPTPSPDDLDDAEVRCAILAGFPDRVVASSPDDPGLGVMVGGRGVKLVGEHERAELTVAVEAREPAGRDRSRSLVSRSCAIERAWLERVLPGSVQVEIRTELDEERGAVFAVRRTRYRDLALEERRGGACDPDETGRLLGGLLEQDPWRYLGEQRELRRFLARLGWLRTVAPELELAAIGEAEVTAAARNFLVGQRNLRVLKDAAILPILRASLRGEQRRALEAHAPDRLALPSGRSARIDYAAGAEPVVSARMQELFGLAEVPLLGAGRVPVVLHLLAPNHRPVQITTDLPSFWTNVYPKVRSELRRRYPRHAWPEDPRTATAEARPRRRRKT